jgi:predicted DNA-binding transcriptional regulator AlpA
MAKANRDFRVLFNGMDDDALITRSELAELLAVSDASVRQMMYLGKMPPKAFPDERRVRFYVRDVRLWFKDRYKERSNPPTKTGRPRHSHDVSIAA